MRSRTSRLPLAALILAAGVSIQTASAAPAPPSDVSPSTSTVTATPLVGALANGTDEVTVEVIVRNASGQPLSNRTVRVSSTVPGDKIAQPVAPTDAQGRAVASFLTETPGLRVIYATVDPDGEAVELAAQPIVNIHPPPIIPNVLIIMVDDVGTDSLSMFDEVNPYRTDLPYVHGMEGEGDIPANGEGTSNLYANTPNLQQLADEGITFLNAYAMPLCSPSRACLLTGNYPVRTGVGAVMAVGNNTGTMNEFGDLGFEFPTLAEMAQSLDYDDIMIGKWHLGLPTVAMHPTSGSNSYLGWASIPQRGKFSEWISVFSNVNTPPQPQSGGTIYNFHLSRNQLDQSVIAANPETQFVTTVLFDEALAWCNSRTGPFVCLLQPTAAHSPWNLDPPFSLVSTLEYVQGPVNAWTGQMSQIEALDTKIGDLINGLSPEVRASTTIIFLSDNGIPGLCLDQASLEGTSGGATGSNKDLGETYEFLLGAPEARFKGSVYEKGSRVPMIVAGYGITNPGRVSSALVDVTDVYPTVAEIIEAEVSEDLHGISFKPVLDDEVDYQTHARNYTYSEFFLPIGSTGPGITFDERLISCSLRIPGQGRYKIVYNQALSGDQFYKLQDAAGNYIDPFETVNLPHGPSDAEYANYLLVLAKMQEVIASGDGTGPVVCQTWDNFCSSFPNSTGSAAIISVASSCSITLNNYTLRAEPVPNQFGIFFYSTGMVNGGNGLPYGNGLRCVGGAGNSVIRLPITQASGNVLQYQLDFMDLPGGGQINVGSTWHFQAWFRDPQGGGESFDLSDALTTTFGT